jgi:hypothetical protein
MDWLWPGSAPRPAGVCTGHALPLSPYGPLLVVSRFRTLASTGSTIAPNLHRHFPGTPTTYAMQPTSMSRTMSSRPTPLPPEAASLPPPALAHDPPAHTRQPRSLRTRARSTHGLVPRRRGPAHVRLRQRSDCARRHNALRSPIRAHNLVRVVRHRVAELWRAPRLVPAWAGAFVSTQTRTHAPKTGLRALYHDRLKSLNAVDPAEIWVRNLDGGRFRSPRGLPVSHGLLPQVGACIARLGTGACLHDGGALVCFLLTSISLSDAF